MSIWKLSIANISCPNHLVDHKRRELRLKSVRYCFIQGGLSWKNLYGIILGCVNKDEAKKLIKELHLRYCGGHYETHTIANKIMRERYYWDTLFTEVHVLSGLSNHVNHLQGNKIFLLYF